MFETKRKMQPGFIGLCLTLLGIVVWNLSKLSSNNMQLLSNNRVYDPKVSGWDWYYGDNPNDNQKVDCPIPAGRFISTCDSEDPELEPKSNLCIFTAYCDPKPGNLRKYINQPCFPELIGNTIRYPVGMQFDRIENQNGVLFSDELPLGSLQTFAVRNASCAEEAKTALKKQI